MGHTEKKKNCNKLKSNNQMTTKSFKEAPEFMQDNGYIRTGYLVNCDTVGKAVKSAFMIHNESVNIWSHFIGALAVAVLIFYTALFVHNYKDQIKEKYTFHLDKFLGELKSYQAAFKDFDNSTKVKIRNFYKNLTDKTNEYFNETKKKIHTGYQETMDSLGSSFEKLKQKSIDFTNNNTKLGVFYQEISSKWNEILDKMEIDNFAFEEFYQKIYNESKPVNKIRRWPIFIMLSSAILCLSFSATFHMLSPISKEINHIFSRLDYAGISLLIAGSCYPPYMYFFYCEPLLRNIYLTFISLFAITVFFLTLTPSFHTPEKRTFRGLLFLALGISAGLPIIHLLLFRSSVSGFTESPRLLFWYVGGACYILGALLYIKRIPEKFWPGTFDIFGSSHQIFHFFVVAGVITHYIGSLDAYYYREDHVCLA